jgi:hypothetical protein
LLYSAEQNGYTIFKFTRPIKVCNEEDRIIEEGSPYVIFAWSDQDPAPSQDISYHGATKRGVRALVLISGPKNKEDSILDVEIMDFAISKVILPKEGSYYYCKGFEVPRTLTQKRHIVKVCSRF